MVENLRPIIILFLYLFLCKVIKAKDFCTVLLYYIILLHLISSFRLPRSLPNPCAYVSVKSIDCILLSSFELKAILSTSSVKTLCFSVLNLCCIFNIDFYEFFYYLRYLCEFPFFSKCFVLFSI